jgi:hypothetical protein
MGLMFDAQQVFADLVIAGKLQKLLIQSYHLSVPNIAIDQRAWHNCAALSSSDSGTVTRQFARIASD